MTFGDDTARENVETPDTPAQADAARGVLSDVLIQGALMQRSTLWAMLTGVIAAVIFAVFSLGGFGGFSTTTQAVIAFAIGGVLIGLMIYLPRRRAVRRSRQEVENALSGPLEEIARVAIRRCGMSASECVRAMVKTLVQAGRVGATFRICPENAADAVEPTSYPFEPRPLEHAHVNQEHSVASSQPASAEASPSFVPSAVRRNITLKGGWFAVVVFGIAILIYAVQAIVQRRVSWMLFCWIALLFILLLIPVRAPRWRARTSECLLVPGGIIFRKSAWRSEKWDLHVFDRRESVLCVHRHWRRQWILTVADKHACETAIGTREEMHFLLRAWLSPLEPPGLEMLSDLA